MRNSSGGSVVGHLHRRWLVGSLTQGMPPPSSSSRRRRSAAHLRRRGCMRQVVMMAQINKLIRECCVSAARQTPWTGSSFGQTHAPIQICVYMREKEAACVCVWCAPISDWILRLHGSESGLFYFKNVALWALGLLCAEWLISWHNSVCASKATYWHDKSMHKQN